MQANKITIGSEYAVKSNNKDGYRTFHVEKIIKTTDTSGTSTQVVGTFADDPPMDPPDPRAPEGTKPKKTFAVSHLEGPVEDYAALMADRKARDEAHTAEQERRKAQVALAAKLFSEATGIPVASGSFSKGIKIGYGGIEVSESHVPALIEHFQKAKE